MAASDNLNPEQLRMFIQAKELMDFPTMEGQKDKPTTLRQNEGLRSKKLRESWDGYEYYTVDVAAKGQKTLYESVKERGVEYPISLRQGSINNGHHRIVTANQINPDMFIPVRHD